MKTCPVVAKTEVVCEPVWEMYFETTSFPPRLVAFYDGLDHPRSTVIPRGTRVTRLNKSACALALALFTTKMRETRGELQLDAGEDRKNILQTWEPQSWLKTLVSTLGRGGNVELDKVFPVHVQKIIGARGGRVSKAWIDKETGKLSQPIWLSCAVTEKFPACLRIYISDRVGGPFVLIADEKKLMELAEKLEDTPGFWETHLFPLDLNSLEAKGTSAVANGANGHTSSGETKANRPSPIIRPQSWREAGEPEEFPELKFKFLNLARAGHEHGCIELLEKHPALCVARFPPNWDCALITAITYGRNRVINHLLRRPEVDINRANEHGMTPLLKASYMNNLNLIKTLVESNREPKVDCRQTNHMGASVIYEAAFRGGVDAYHIIKYFHEDWGIPCDQQTHDWFLPLTLAIWRRCDEKTIKYLIEHTGDLNVADFYGETPFFKAVKYSYLQAVNLLIDVGGSRLERTRMPGRHLTEGASELFRAVHYGDYAHVKKLLDHGNKDIDEAARGFERSPLHEAVDRGHLEIVEELIARGANVFIQNDHGRIPRDFLPWKRTTRFNRIEDILEEAEEAWIEKWQEKLPRLQLAL